MQKLKSPKGSKAAAAQYSGVAKLITNLYYYNHPAQIKRALQAYAQSGWVMLRNPDLPVEPPYYIIQRFYDLAVQNWIDAFLKQLPELAKDGKKLRAFLFCMYHGLKYKEYCERMFEILKFFFNRDQMELQTYLRVPKRMLFFKTVCDPIFSKRGELLNTKAFQITAFYLLQLIENLEPIVPPRLSEFWRSEKHYQYFCDYIGTEEHEDWRLAIPPRLYKEVLEELPKFLGLYTRPSVVVSKRKVGEDLTSRGELGILHTRRRKIRKKKFKEKYADRPPSDPNKMGLNLLDKYNI